MRRHNPMPVLHRYDAIYAHGVEVARGRTDCYSYPARSASTAMTSLVEGGFGPQCRQAIANLEACARRSAKMTLAAIS